MITIAVNFQGAAATIDGKIFAAATPLLLLQKLQRSRGQDDTVRVYSGDAYTQYVSLIEAARGLTSAPARETRLVQHHDLQGRNFEHLGPGR